MFDPPTLVAKSVESDQGRPVPSGIWGIWVMLRHGIRVAIGTTRAAVAIIPRLLVGPIRPSGLATVTAQYQKNRS